MTLLVCDEPKGKWCERDGGWDEVDMILGPSKRTITSAPDIDMTVPMILARVFELLKASFSILFEAPRYT